MSRAKSFDTLAIMAINLITVAIILANIQIPVIRPLLTLFMFGSLGYSIVLAWAPELASQGPVVILLSLALSLSITALIGLLLHFTTMGLQPGPWSVMTTAIILVHCQIVVWRRTRQTFASRPQLDLKLNMGQSALVVLALVITGASVVVARTGVMNQPVALYTQLWMVPSSSKDASSVQLGIKNEEGQSLTYHLVVKQGDSVTQDYPTIELTPGQDWQSTLDLQDLNTADVPIEALLYRLDDPNTVYRSVSLK